MRLEYIYLIQSHVLKKVYHIDNPIISALQDRLSQENYILVLLDSRAHSGNSERPLRLFWDSSKSCEPPYLFQHPTTQTPS